MRQLTRLAARHAGLPRLLVAEPEHGWAIEVLGFDPLRERDVESVLAVGNGLCGTRGSLEEGHAASSPGTYVSGAYVDRLGATANPELAVGPDWTHLTTRIDGSPVVALEAGTVLEHRRVLDLRHGVLWRTWRQRLPSGTVLSFRSARFASLADPRVLVLWAEVSGGSATADFAAGAAGATLTELPARYGPVTFATNTHQSRGRAVRICAVDPHRPPTTGEAGEILARAEALGVEELFARHRACWQERWNAADVVVEGDDDAQRALRFAIHHLISAGDDSGQASIGARGLTGPGYHGHVFWDTDVFVLPFFIATHPPTARALLTYRYARLPAARAKAASLGYAGALFPWESADTGEEVTPAFAIDARGERIPIRTGDQEHHIAADVAWAAWRYWQMTGDDEFWATMGAEILVETARFWASRATRQPDGRLHICDVIGPDEYHESVTDNAFTNALARWNLDAAASAVDRAPAGLLARLRIRATEPKHWRRVAADLVDGFDPPTGLFEQFAGYFDLEELMATDLAERPFAADLVLDRHRLQRSQLIKQADVIMAAHMLPELLPEEVAAVNYRFYEPRTTHGSSLSPAIHAAVAARIGALDDALASFHLAARVDLDNGMGNAAHGLHLATMGGLWQAAVAGFGGTRPDHDALRIDPHLPAPWRRLAFPLRWRGTRVHIDIREHLLVLTLDGTANVAVGPRSPVRLRPGRHLATRDAGTWALLEDGDPP